MTVYLCTTCGQGHNTATDPPCPQVVFAVPAMVPTAASTPKQVGAHVRALLLALERESERKQALDHAGFCWGRPGEMAPGCGCTAWSEEHPEGSREFMESMQQRRLENDEVAKLARAWRASERSNTSVSYAMLSDDKALVALIVALDEAEARRT